jgi:mannitol-1-/sugar-/sorbitol-6-phosphatase
MMPSGAAVSLSFKTALFDMDGTLVDSTAIIEEEWRRWANDIGRDPEDVLSIAHGRRTEEVIQTIAPERPILEELVRFLQLAATVDQHHVSAVPGAIDFVSALDAADWAVVTSAPRPIAVERLRLAGFPEPRLLISADEVRNGKPDPEGFLLAATGLKAAVGDCLVFEDSPAGIRAGCAAGVRVIALATTHSQLGYGELYEVRNFADLAVTRENSSYKAFVSQRF